MVIRALVQAEVFSGDVATDDLDTLIKRLKADIRVCRCQGANKFFSGHVIRLPSYQQNQSGLGVVTQYLADESRAEIAGSACYEYRFHLHISLFLHSAFLIARLVPEGKTPENIL
jgi:hypothetical protein